MSIHICTGRGWKDTKLGVGECENLCVNMFAEHLGLSGSCQVIFIVSLARAFPSINVYFPLRYFVREIQLTYRPPGRGNWAFRFWRKLGQARHQHEFFHMDTFPDRWHILFRSRILIWPIVEYCRGSLFKDYSMLEKFGFLFFFKIFATN